jgi:plastocyanin domain-containing protein
MTRTLLCAALVVAAAACSKDTKNSGAPASSDPSRIAIDVTKDGFSPEHVTVPAAKPVTLVFDRKTDETCAKQVVLDPGDGKKITKDLPLNQPVEVAVTFPKAGDLTYACGMDMFHGTITVQ